jgi:hypothetical protein
VSDFAVAMSQSPTVKVRTVPKRNVVGLCAQASIRMPRHSRQTYPATPGNLHHAEHRVHNRLSYLATSGNTRWRDLPWVISIATICPHFGSRLTHRILIFILQHSTLLELGFIFPSFFTLFPSVSLSPRFVSFLWLFLRHVPHRQ